MNALAAAMAGWRGAGETIALVPTMGALHAGAFDLVTEARRVGDVSSRRSSSIRSSSNDGTSTLSAERGGGFRDVGGGGVRRAVVATAGEIYPDGFATTVSVAGVSERWEARIARGISTALRRWSPSYSSRSARPRVLRGKGLAAVGGDQADDRRPGAAAWRSSAFRPCARMTDWRVVAQRLSVGGRAANAPRLLQALEQRATRS